jgi:hypothetical protein
MFKGAPDGKVHERKQPKKEVGDDEVGLRITYSGVRGTDLHSWTSDMVRQIPPSVTNSPTFVDRHVKARDRGVVGIGWARPPRHLICCGARLRSRCVLGDK